MATNPYFNHTGAVNEQDLYHDLATEMIQLAGMDVRYLKVESINDANYDPILGENRFEELEEATIIEMYLKDYEQPYAGDDFYAKFGLSQPHTCTLLVGVRRFMDELGHRPREGDYVYIPKTDFLGPDDLFRIHKVDFVDAQWKALGSPVYFFLRCERAKFTHQDLTGADTELDADLMTKEDVRNDRNDDSDPLQELGDLLIDFNEKNLFGEP